MGRHPVPEECFGTRGRGWRQTDLESDVSEALRAIVLDEEFLSACDAEARKSTSAAGGEVEAALAEERRRLTVAYRLGGMTDQEYAEALGDLKRRGRPPRQSRDEVRTGVAAFRSFAQVWDIMTPEERRTVAAELVDSVAVDLWARDWWVAPRSEYEELFRLRSGQNVGLVRPGGLEPPTFWSATKRAIRCATGAHERPGNGAEGEI